MAIMALFLRIAKRAVGRLLRWVEGKNGQNEELYPVCLLIYSNSLTITWKGLNSGSQHASGKINKIKLGAWLSTGRLLDEEEKN